ncbi:MAG: hypothetical protein IV088_24450 [Hydrogenophaga sp.]|uniref:hypothetical protein n=1 Tax=Hydrogenophaga sp. TaxID=1904254 RepID=UPI0025BBAF8D|nr:hypothetical protein [Hydrogenophaga sp.]MBT9554007.1 hypothetical protein [Hydrogenophaga sp.]
MPPPDRNPLPPEYPGMSETPLPSDGITPFERGVNLAVAAVLVALGLYALYGPV